MISQTDAPTINTPASIKLDGSLSSSPVNFSKKSKGNPQNTNNNPPSIVAPIRFIVCRETLEIDKTFLITKPSPIIAIETPNTKSVPDK